MNFNFDAQNTRQGGSQILNLQKNQVLNLSKRAPQMKKAVLAGGWDMAVSGPSADLDLAAFLLDSSGHIHSGSDVIFFNNLQTPTHPGIRLEGDNRTGAGEGDDERIDVDLERMDRSVSRIVFVITIFEAEKKRQSFGMVKNAYVRLLDATGRDENEICRYNLTEDYSTDTAIIACELSRDASGWEFKAVGEGFIGDLNDIANRYI